MKISVLFTLPLAIALMLPAVAQQAPPSESQQPSATSSSSRGSSQPTTTTPDANSDQDMSARQPLEPERHWPSAWASASSWT